MSSRGKITAAARCVLRALARGIAVSALSLPFAEAGNSTCQLNNLRIDPIAPDRRDVFIGKSAHVEVRFVNERTKGEVTVFPEPPLVISNRQAKIECSIDGGVWVRKAVYLSANEKMLVTQEFSGSNDRLTFYSTENCKKLSEIDISNSGWSISGSEITVSSREQVGNRPAGERTYRLDSTCLPRDKARG